MLVIDPEECIDCGACEAECPVEAIYPGGALPADLVRFVGINEAITDGADAARTAVDTYADSHTLPPIAGYRG
jgi:ferredoxin